MVKKKFKKKDIAITLLVAVIVILILTFYVWHQVESVRLGYEINRLEAQIQKLTEEVEELEAKKTAHLSPDKVEQIATQKLGMRPVRPDQVIDSKSKQDISGR